MDLYGIAMLGIKQQNYDFDASLIAQLILAKDKLSAISIAHKMCREIFHAKDGYEDWLVTVSQTDISSLFCAGGDNYRIIVEKQ